MYKALHATPQALLLLARQAYWADLTCRAGRQGTHPLTPQQLEERLPPLSGARRRLWQRRQPRRRQPPLRCCCCFPLPHCAIAVRWRQAGWCAGSHCRCTGHGETCRHCSCGCRRGCRVRLRSKRRCSHNVIHGKGNIVLLLFVCTDPASIATRAYTHPHKRRLNSERPTIQLSNWAAVLNNRVGRS